MKENYNNLCIFNFGKRCYVIMKNNNKVLYFESVEGKFVMPIINFNLFANEGKSLTVVNQHFFMNQLINRINVALNKGYFNTDKEIIDFLSDMKSKIENDQLLRNLFKGSLMGEINEENFESNKREILKYLDKFKFNTFVAYNNVSIFNGSLEKNVPSDEVVDNVDEIDNSSLEIENVNESDIDVVSENSNEIIDFSINPNISDDIETVDSSEYFNNIQNDAVNNNIVVDTPVIDEVVEPVVEAPVMSQVVEPVVEAPVMNQVVEPVVEAPVINQVVEPVVEAPVMNQVVEPVVEAPVMNQAVEPVVEAPVMNQVVEPVGSVPDVNVASSYYDLLSDIGNVNTDISGNSFIDSSVNVGTNTSSSYIDDVKTRIQSNIPVDNGFNSNSISEEKFIPNENVDLGNKVINDKNELPELESISNSAVEKDNTVKEKNKVGIIVFLIIFIVLLIVAAYFLYLYVF